MEANQPGCDILIVLTLAGSFCYMIGCHILSRKDRKDALREGIHWSMFFRFWPIPRGFFYFYRHRHSPEHRGIRIALWLIAIGFPVFVVAGVVVVVFCLEAG